jgi:hypothetical protein
VEEQAHSLQENSVDSMSGRIEIEEKGPVEACWDAVRLKMRRPGEIYAAEHRIQLGLRIQNERQLICPALIRFWWWCSARYSAECLTKRPLSVHLHLNCPIGRPRGLNRVLDWTKERQNPPQNVDLPRGDTNSVCSRILVL